MNMNMMTVKVKMKTSRFDQDILGGEGRSRCPRRIPTSRATQYLSR